MKNPERVVLETLQGGSKWTKQTYEDGGGRMCLVGAARKKRCASKLSNLAAVIKEQYPERTFDPAPISSSSGTVIAFNDHAKTTWADVERVLEKAALRRDEMLAD
jgi:hypothetical protein